MSIDFQTKDVCLSEVFGGRLAAYGITERVTESTTEIHRCLTDGNNYLWACAQDAYSGDTLFTAYGCNCPSRILRAIEEVFDAFIYSEYEPQFGGFKTQEEWDAAMAEMEKAYKDEFYADILRYIDGEQSGVVAGTIGEIQAKIAKQLIESDPSLRTRKDDLLRILEETYDRDHSVKITLSPAEMAFANMAATHEDDLPRA
jgi:hypothetical protein